MPNFEALNLAVNTATNEITFNNQKIQVKKYLPVETKAGIVNLAVRGSLLKGIVDEVLVDAYFHLFIVENYTDIIFDQSELSDILVNYDKIISSGLLDEILNAVPQEEYNYLIDCLGNFKEQMIKYSQSPAAANENSEEYLKLLTQMSEKAQPVTKPRTRKSVN
jgi:hypothetical protein